MKSLLFILALFPSLSFAGTVLCIPDAGALVADGGGSPASAGIADVSSQKFLLTQENGHWVVKELGKGYVLFDKCTNPYFCEHSVPAGLTTGFAGVFIRTDKGTFSIMWITKQKNGLDQWIVAKGRCSKI